MEKEILNLIDNSTNALIITHVNPDGDTLGSASALRSYMGEKADILIQIKDNFEFPQNYSFLPFINKSLNFSTLENKSYDLIIAVDVASIDRIISPARELFENCDNTIVIDHHKTNEGFGKYNLIKGGISSTGEVLFDLLENNNIEISSDVATGLYAAILTDTGCYKYESTTPHTFDIASKLANKVNTSNIADLCYTNKPKNLVLFQSELIAKAEFPFNGKIGYTLITKEIIQKYNAKNEYSEGIAEAIRAIAGVEIAFVLKETEFGTKVSIRTKDVDATKISDVFQGGGHKRAAGCTIKLNINQATEKLLSVSKELL